MPPRPINNATQGKPGATSAPVIPTSQRRRLLTAPV